MNLLAEAMDGLGAALLPVAAGLLLEEFTFGGLVRLLLAPRPTTRKRVGTGPSPARCKRGERKPQQGEPKCSH